jgi:hypothetical protein
VTQRASLSEFIVEHRQNILDRCHDDASSRGPRSGMIEREEGVEVLLDQLAAQLGSGTPTTSDIVKTATQYGHGCVVQGCSVAELVHAYGDVCQAITAVALEQSAAISTAEFRNLNRCLDDAIAGAVTEYSRERELTTRTSASHNERLELLARELRSSINTARVALRVIKSGNVGLAGSTGAIVDENLIAAQDMADRLLEIFVACRALGPP